MNGEGQTATIEAAKEKVSDERTQEYLEMERLFAEHGQETEPETLTGEASISDFTINQTVDETDGVIVRLYFTLPNDKHGLFGATHTNDTPNPLIQAILEKNHTPPSLL